MYSYFLNDIVIQIFSTKKELLRNLRILLRAPFFIIFGFITLCAGYIYLRLYDQGMLYCKSISVVVTEKNK